MPLAEPAAAAPRARPRYRPQPKRWWQRIPLSLRLLLPVAAAGLGYMVYDDYVGSHATITFVADEAGAAVPPLQLTFFPMGDMLVSPSPMPPSGVRELIDTARLTVGAALVPGRGMLRFSGPGIGSGFCVVELGKPVTVQLAPPTQVRGRVVRWRPTFCLLETPFEPVPGARVIAMGGGARGVPLTETTSDADGWFTLTGLAANLDMVGLRLADDGYAIDNHDVPLRLPELASDQDVPQPLLLTVPTAPVRGHVVLPEDLQPRDLVLVARSLPGVGAPVGADGSFVLDNVPPGVQPRLLVYGLPERYTHLLTRCRSGERDVSIEIQPSTTISGWVLDANTRQPVGGADVYHDNGPMGLVGATTALNGTFTIGQVPPGILRLSAQHRGRRVAGSAAVVRAGFRDLEVEAGKPLKSIIVTVE